MNINYFDVSNWAANNPLSAHTGKIINEEDRC
jgi:hypothetical protein